MEKDENKKPSELNMIGRVINIFGDVKDGFTSVKQQDLYFYETNSRGNLKNEEI